MVRATTEHTIARNSDRSPIALYWDSIARYEPLTREGEAELARRIRDGDDTALQELV